ncbi:Phosphoribosyl-ATP pyrophosphatase [Methanosarcinaceae archaeon Ag5]|uniref:Phosphoribosyl-ATP pyrophosphatase n=1 Tax=Methanolapillus africanus TaxID=3028297 RepID=A0AAE4MJI1_9EURY|nr:Phosphoribosyl-ATP pyrophosphatase [Methanosarcinaceae archaeon Ag5]
MEKAADLSVLTQIYQIIEERSKTQPEGSYVCALLNDPKGVNKILEKVGEEATETILAVKDGKRDEIIYETSDLLFHLMVMLFECGVTPEDIAAELARRHK